MAERPTGTVTFLFTDIEGSTQLWENDRAAMEAALARHDEILHEAFAEHDGFVFAAGGDGFCVAFARAEAAVEAAIAAQRGLGSESWPPGSEIRVRMGLHTGEAQERAGNYFGPALNRIGRLHAVAHGRQVVVSDTTEPLVRSVAELVDLGVHGLRDVAESSSVFQVVAEGLVLEFPPLRTAASFRVMARQRSVSGGLDWTRRPAWRNILCGRFQPARAAHRDRVPGWDRPRFRIVPGPPVEPVLLRTCGPVCSSSEHELLRRRVVAVVRG